MEEVEQRLDEIMASNPEFTFREAVASLVKAGDLEFIVLEDPYIHAALHSRFALSKSRANDGRLNTDI